MLGCWADLDLWLETEPGNLECTIIRLLVGCLLEKHTEVREGLERFKKSGAEDTFYVVAAKALIESISGDPNTALTMCL